MMRRCVVGLPVLAGMFAGVIVRPAFAADPSCTAVTLEATASVTTRWPGLLNEVREAFEERDDIDRCAQVALTARGTSVTVEVFLPDGRSAVRPVSRRQDVVPTLEALLLLPESAAETQPPAALDAAAPTSLPPNSPSTPPESSVPGPPVLPSVRAARDRAGSSPERPARRLGIELSVLTGARIGDGQSAVGLGALPLLDLSGWLLGFEGRADRYEPLPSGPMDGAALELAVLGGRRFPFGNVALDLIVGGAVAIEEMRSDTSSQSSTAGTTVTEPASKSSSTVPRLLIGARVDFGALSILRTFAGIDGELSSARALGPDVPGAPRLPLWTLGIALGATVGTP